MANYSPATILTQTAVLTVWLKALTDLTESLLEKVLGSDDTQTELFSHRGKGWVWYKRNTSHHPEIIIHIVKHASPRMCYLQQILTHCRLILDMRDCSEVMITDKIWKVLHTESIWISMDWHFSHQTFKISTQEPSLMVMTWQHSAPGVKQTNQTVIKTIANQFISKWLTKKNTQQIKMFIFPYDVFVKLPCTRQKE